MAVSRLTTVRWGILGVGDVCEVKAGPAFQKAQGSELVAVMRRTASKAEDFAKRHGVPRWYTDADELLSDPEVNAVYIATPPRSHLELALKCAEKGLPTYVEKPAARNATETRIMVEAFESRGVPLFIAYYRRGQERFLKAKEVVQSGEIGMVTSLSYKMTKPMYAPSVADEPLPWRLVAEEAGGGLVMDVGCHTIDICDFIVGPLRDASGCASRLAGAPYAVEDRVALTARFESASDADGGIKSDAIASMTWSFVEPTASHQSEDEIVVRGTRGELRLSTFGSEPVRVSVANPATGDMHVTEYEFPRPEHVHQPLVQTIVDELRGVAGRPPCPSRGDNAIRVADVIDAALAGYYGGRADAFWEREATWPQSFDGLLQASSRSNADDEGLPPLIRTPPGLYRHYKGGMYEVIDTVRHSETLEPMTLYRALYGKRGLWVRPAAMFDERVTVDGVEVSRFTRVGPGAL